MKANLKRMGVPLHEIRYALATHYHIDHAGLGEELKREGVVVLDDGSVFTGDLPPEAYAFDNPVALASWRLLRERGASRVYPAHGPARAIDETPGHQA
jgi:glyoxylase-like metal-dependent hydrolase (beta-lactamase superfamily II)